MPKSKKHETISSPNSPGLSLKGSSKRALSTATASSSCGQASNENETSIQRSSVDLMRKSSSSKKQALLAKKSSLVASAAAVAVASTAIPSGSSSAASSLSSSKQELHLASVLDINNNEIVAATLGGGVGGGAELVAKSNSISGGGFSGGGSKNPPLDDTADADPTKLVSPVYSPTTPFLSAQPQQLLKVNAKLNDKFHQLFPSIPIDEYLIDTYSCAYAKSLNLYQGMMFLTKNFICFYSKILNHTILILKFSRINSITKSMHAVIFPTAIRIETHNGVYAFTSFLSRSHTLDHLVDLLKQWRQRQIDEVNLRHKSRSLFHASRGGFDTTSNDSDLKHKNSTLSMSDMDKLESSGLGVSLPSPNSQMTKDDDEIIEEMVLDSPRDSFHPSKLKMSTSSPLIVNKSDLSPSRVADQFRIFKTGSTDGYYDYCYGQQLPSDNLFYDFDFSDLSKNMVTVSLRHRQTLLQKVKILMSILIPGFFNISRIDALLPICFLMCVLLLLNAFVLLNKVNQVDEIFTQLLTKNDF